MSTVEWVVSRLEKAGDWANPILVKETRQALKSRQFVSTFLLLLLASWVASVLGVVWYGDSMEYGRAGRDFFAVFYCVLAVAVLVVVPFGASRSLISERDENTFELLSITSLTPRQIVWGKLLSALVQVFIYYSAIAPFIAFTSLLQGFDLAQVTYLLALLLIVSLGYSMISLMLSTQARQRHTQIMMTLGMVVAVLVGYFTYLQIAFALMAFAAFDDRDFWVGNGLFLLAFFSYFVLLLQIATAQLTFESGNRSTAIRFTLSMHFWLFWATIFFMCWYVGSTTVPNEVVVAMASLAGIHWTAAGLIAATESETLSRRIRRGLPRLAGLRFLLAPFLPGGSRGYLYAVLHVIALWVIVVFVVPHFLTVSPPFMRAPLPTGGPSSAVFPGAMPPGAVPAPMAPASPFSLFVPPAPLSPPSSFVGWLGEGGVFTTALCCYILIYLGIASLLGRAAQRVVSEIRPGHLRFITILVALLGVIVPYIIRIIRNDRTQPFYEAIDLLNPFVTFARIVGGSGESDPMILKWLIPVAILFVAVNLRAMFNGVSSVVSDPLPGSPPVVRPTHEDVTVRAAGF